MERVARWLEDPFSVEEIVASRSLRWGGVALTALHALAWAFYAPFNILSEEHHPLQLCWPIYPDCFERALFSEFWAVAQGYLVLAGAALTAVLFLLPGKTAGSGQPWAVKTAHLLLLILSLWRQILFSQSYRFMGNYNQFGSYALTAYLLLPRKLEVLRLYLPSFYAIASMLKFNTEWLSGAAMINPVAVQGPLLLAGNVYVIALEAGLVPWGLTHPGGWQFWFTVGNLLYFHAFSWHLVGFYYPCVMTCLLTLPVLARLGRDDEAVVEAVVAQDGAETATPSSRPRPGVCCGRYATSPQQSVAATASQCCRPWLRLRRGAAAYKAGAESSATPPPRHRRLASTTIVALAWLWGQQFIPFLFGGDTALHGEGRFFSINMFDARGACFAEAFEHVTDGGAVPVTTDVSSDDILSLPGTGIRVRCDPMAFWTVARTLCAEANGLIFHSHDEWLAAKSGGTNATAGAAAAFAAGAARGPGGPTGRLVDLDLYMQGRRSSDDDFTPLMQARNVCSRPENFSYKLFSHNAWISPRNARALGPLLRRDVLGLSSEDTPRTTAWKTSFAGPLAHSAAPEELVELQPFPSASAPPRTPVIDPSSWLETAWASLFPIASPGIDVSRYSPAASLLDPRTGKLQTFAASMAEHAEVEGVRGPRPATEPDPVAAAFFASAIDSTWYNPVALPVPFNFDGVTAPPAASVPSRTETLAAMPSPAPPASLWLPRFLSPPRPGAQGEDLSSGSTHRGYVSLPIGHTAVDVREFADLYGSGLGTALVAAAKADPRRGPDAGAAAAAGETCTDRRRRAGRRLSLDASEGMSLVGDPASDPDAVRALACDYIDVYDVAFIPPPPGGNHSGPGLVFLTSSASIIGLHGAGELLASDYHSEANPHLQAPGAGASAAAAISTWIFNGDTQGLLPSGLRPSLVLDDARVYAASAHGKGRLYGVGHADGALAWAVTVGVALLSPHRLVADLQSPRPRGRAADPSAALRSPAGLYVLAQTSWGLNGPAGFGGTAMVGWSPPQVSLVKLRPADGVVVFRSPSLTYTQHVVYDLAVDAAAELACVLVVRAAAKATPADGLPPGGVPFLVVTCFSTEDGAIVTEVPLDPADVPVPPFGPNGFVSRPRRPPPSSAPMGWAQESDIPGVHLSAAATLAFLPTASTGSPLLLVTTAAGHVAVVRISGSSQDAPRAAAATPASSSPPSRINVTDTVALLDAEAAAVVLQVLGGEDAHTAGTPASSTSGPRVGTLAFVGHVGAFTGSSHFNPMVAFAVDGAPTLAPPEVAAAAGATAVATFRLSRRAPPPPEAPFLDPYAEVDDEGAPVTIVTLAFSVSLTDPAATIAVSPLWLVTTGANSADLQTLNEERAQVLAAVHRLAKADFKDPGWTAVASFAADDEDEEEDDEAPLEDVFSGPPQPPPSASLVAPERPRGVPGPAGTWSPTLSDIAEVAASDVSVVPSASLEGDLLRAAQSLADALPRDAAPAPAEADPTGGAASVARVMVLRGATPQKGRDSYSAHADLHIPQGAGAGTLLGAAPRTPVSRPVATFWGSGGSGWAYVGPCPADARFVCLFNATSGALLDASPMSPAFSGSPRSVPLLLPHTVPPTLAPESPPSPYAAPFLPGASVLALGEDNALRRLSVVGPVPAPDGVGAPQPPAGFRGARTDAAAAAAAAAGAKAAAGRRAPRSPAAAAA